MIALLLILTVVGIAAAQTSGGQICVRAFEDRNGNGQKDENEPPIIHGLSASLINEQGIIIETMLMDSSPNASSGMMCFQRLEAAQYSMRVSSADYMATTTNEFIGVVSDTGIPVVFPYGGQVIPIEVPQTTHNDALSLTARDQQTLFAKLVIAVLGAIIIMGAMMVVGAIIYFVFLRKRPQPLPATSAYPRVPDIAAYVPINDTGDYLHPSLDDTDQVRPPEMDHNVSVAMYEDTDLPQARPTVTSRPTVAAPPDPYADAPEDDFSFEPDDDEDDPDSAFRPPEA
jgi:hypothetical protein